MSSKKFFILFFMCCSLPVLAAKLYLDSGLASQGLTSNKGQWLQQNIQLPVQPDASSKHWYLMYVQSDTCTQLCEHALYTLQQIYTGLGRKQLQVRPLVLSKNKFIQLEKFPALEWQMEIKKVNELQSSLVIVNQQGLALLRYPVIDDMNQMAKTAKDVRADLRRLMNYDRGGF